MSINCPYCGYENQDSSSFCGKCAESLIESSTKKHTPFQHIQLKQIQDLLDKKQQHPSGCFCCLVFALIVGFILFVIFLLSKIDKSEFREKSTEEPKPTYQTQKYDYSSAYFINNINDYTKYKIKNIGFWEYYGMKYFKIYAKDLEIYFSITGNRELTYGYQIDTKDIKYSGVQPAKIEAKLMTYWLILGSQFIRVENDLTALLEKSEVSTVCIDNPNVWIFLNDGIVISAYIEPKYNPEIKQTYNLISHEKVMLNTLFTEKAKIPVLISSYYIRDKNLIFLFDQKNLYCLKTGIDGELIHKAQKPIYLKGLDAKILASTFYEDNYWFLLSNGKILTKSKAEMLVLAGY